MYDIILLWITYPQVRYPKEDDSYSGGTVLDLRTGLGVVANPEHLSCPASQALVQSSTPKVQRVLHSARSLLSWVLPHNVQSPQVSLQLKTSKY